MVKSSGKCALVHAAVAIAVALIGASATACADEIVVPNEVENVEGGTNNGFPFHIANFSLPSQRYQQVYGADDFAALSGPVLITEIRFRPDGTTGNAFASVLADVQINLSTTTMGPDGLSATFADNIGPDETVVHSGPLALSSSDTGPGPRDFDIVIELQTPFLYDPAAGDLLMDVRNFEGGLTTQFDAHFEIDDTSRATTNVASSGTGHVNSPTASVVDSIGLVTKFVTVPAVLPVAIDVKPGSDENPVNLKSSSRSRGRSQSAGGVIPVAILSTDDFDATTTDPDAEILLGDPELGAAVPPVRGTLEDVDDDGDLDVLLHFSIQELVEAGAIDEETVALGLTASTLDGLGIAGLDFVTIVPGGP